MCLLWETACHSAVCLLVHVESAKTAGIGNPTAVLEMNQLQRQDVLKCDVTFIVYTHKHNIQRGPKNGYTFKMR